MKSLLWAVAIGINRLEGGVGVFVCLVFGIKQGLNCQAVLELRISLPQFPMCWECGPGPLHLA